MQIFLYIVGGLALVNAAWSLLLGLGTPMLIASGHLQNASSSGLLMAVCFGAAGVIGAVDRAAAAVIARLGNGTEG